MRHCIVKDIRFPYILILIDMYLPPLLQQGQIYCLFSSLLFRFSYWVLLLFALPVITRATRDIRIGIKLDQLIRH